ncbi:Sas10/Utp3/C1D family-domain-containing protein [Xylariaceae sp. FL0662B]|nr:Sas10/Utp3/C1D family-domain-containing protein [Xylariaceae sp. FL0662B]
MDPTNISPQLERLDDELDNLEEALQPLLNSIPEVASKLPLLDKAKLYVLVTYSIESMLFSSLRLHGVNAKDHPVFKELTRVRQYFEKIKNIENPPQKPEQTLNKEAAIRFIRADLADNKEIGAKLTEMIAKERAIAAAKAAKAGEKRKTDESNLRDESDSGSESDNNPEAAQKEQRKKKDKKHRKEPRKEKKKGKKSSM